MNESQGLDILICIYHLNLHYVSCIHSLIFSNTINCVDINEEEHAWNCNLCQRKPGHNMQGSVLFSLNYLFRIEPICFFSLWTAC